jgi:uncharacterized protein (DUF2384 family)
MSKENVRKQSPVHSDAVATMETRKELARLLRTTFETSSDARRWWRSPHPMLSGVAPVVAVRTAAGVIQLRDMLIALRYGGVV